MLVRRRLAASEAAATSRLSEIEIASAVHRRKREGVITLRDRDRILAAIDSDFASLVVVELTPAVCARARALLQVHSLRASDAAQLASCLSLQEALGESVCFVCFDARLTRAAHAEGVEVEPAARSSR